MWIFLKRSLSKLIRPMLALTIAGCGHSFINYSSILDNYFSSLAEGRYVDAISLMCADSRAAFDGDPARLGLAYVDQLDRLDLVGSWETLRGDDKISSSDFFLERDGEFLTLDLPIVYGGDVPQVCPTAGSPLGLVSDGGT